LIQLIGGFSLMAGNTFGRFIGIVGGSLGAIGALLSIGGTYPWWSLGIFFLCLWIVHGILIYGVDERAAHPERSGPRLISDEKGGPRWLRSHH
jgi:hypothetical protein